MPPPPQPDAAVNAWLEDRFAAYYANHPPELPDRFGRREYGFMFHGGKGMLRHVAFPTRREFERFHAERGPAHSYYSTAYYQRPDAPTMNEKGWLGAELIFDLDADHVPGSEKKPYPEQLAIVKRHFIRLVDEFVRRDFGFDEKPLLLTFSGGRGYHCHVLAEKAVELTSQERREIVDYITGTGLVPERFGYKVAPVAERKSKFGPKYSFRVPPAGAPGWGGRINDVLIELVTRFRDGAPFETFLEEFKDLQVETLKGTNRKPMKKELQELYDQLRRTDPARVRDGYFDMGRVMQNSSPYIILARAVPLGKGETDEPVTSDTKRLIRTPGTLHGKSGLRVVKLSRGQLDAFDPLVDAIAFSDEPVKVQVAKPFTVALKGQSIPLEPGVATVPEWAAVFALMRGVASVVEKNGAR